jgi:hypothetical protein
MKQTFIVRQSQRRALMGAAASIARISRHKDRMFFRQNFSGFWVNQALTR